MDEESYYNPKEAMKNLADGRKDDKTSLSASTFYCQMETLNRRVQIKKPIEMQEDNKRGSYLEQTVLVTKEKQKVITLLSLLKYKKNHMSVLITVEMKETAAFLVNALATASYNSAALITDMDSFHEEAIICDLKAGKVDILVATTIEKLEIRDIGMIINYDIPHNFEDCVRKCVSGQGGPKNITFITGKEGHYACGLIAALKFYERKIPENLQKLYSDYKLNQKKIPYKSRKEDLNDYKKEVQWYCNRLSAKEIELDTVHADMETLKIQYVELFNKYRKLLKEKENSDSIKNWEEEIQRDVEGDSNSFTSSTSICQPDSSLKQLVSYSSPCTSEELVESFSSTLHQEAPTQSCTTKGQGNAYQQWQKQAASATDPNVTAWAAYSQYYGQQVCQMQQTAAQPPGTVSSSGIACQPDHNQTAFRQ